jgi:hypothetical protein
MYALAILETLTIALVLLGATAAVGRSSDNRLRAVKLRRRQDR